MPSNSITTSATQKIEHERTESKYVSGDTNSSRAMLFQVRIYLILGSTHRLPRYAANTSTASVLCLLFACRPENVLTTCFSVMSSVPWVVGGRRVLGRYRQQEASTESFERRSMRMARNNMPPRYENRTMWLVK